MKSLVGKKVMITAAASGVGRGIAQAFLDAGAGVHICDISAEGLREFQTKASGLGCTVADVSDPTAVERFFTEARDHLGGLDVMVNNAGIAGPTGSLEEITCEQWHQTMDVNLNGQFYCLRHAIPLLKEAKGGSIVNVSSTAGLMGYPMRTAYAASKWAVIGLSKSLSMELGPFAVRVNAICPGSVGGDRMDRVIAAEAKARGISTQAVRQTYLKQSSLGTFVDPVDVANLVLFICSDAGVRISGQSLCVDGGTQTLAG